MDLWAHGEPVEVFAPFTGERLHLLPQSTVDDVRGAAASARAAQPGWWAAGFAHRKRILLRAHDVLMRRREQLLDSVQIETGKSRGQAFEEVFQAISATRYNALAARRVLSPERRRAGIPFVLKAGVYYRPKGLVGVITPWNHPLSLAMMDIVPALAAGNAVVQKADDQAAASILAARRAFVDAGLPAELWTVVTGPGDTVGNAVIDNADYVCFTGSTGTGTRVATRAAAKLTGASLELGGKNALIVLDDVDPQRAGLDAAYACFSCMGQLCVAIERVYVLRSVADEFISSFVEHSRSLVQNGRLDYTADVGSLTTPAQLERVQQHVTDALERGASVLTGAQHLPELGPLFYAPTILTGITPEMRCATEETFGAVATLTVVDDENEAIEAANASRFALNAAIFSGSRARARRIAARLVSGSVNINEGYRASFASVDAPMGGRRLSGLGRRNGPEGLLRFADSTTVAEATGLVRLPRKGREFARLTGLMLALLTVLRTLRRR